MIIKRTIPGLFLVLVCVFCVRAAETPRSEPSVDFSHGDIQVHPGKRFLQHHDGTPFFYLGDTAWELFHRLNIQEAERYLENRRQKGFTVIQAVVLAELDGLNTPNANGDRPLINNDPTKPNEAYFKHVDAIVKIARKKGLVIGMLPTWGDKTVTLSWGKGPVVFTNDRPEVPKTYGRFLGKRYKDTPNIIWILIGDRPGNGYESVWRAMAEGLSKGDDGRHLITCHPMGGHSSSEWFHNENWLDFNMLQSGHGTRDNPNYRKILADYRLTPVKPCIDGEPRYENHPINWKPESGWFNDFDVRQGCYWAVFAGGMGVTYGCHDIWQMMAPGRQPVSSARGTWYGSLDLPGAWDMLHLRRLMLSRPYFDRLPDQSIIAAMPKEEGRHIVATRGEQYALVYSPYGDEIELRMGKITGEKVNVWWFNPRTGEAQKDGVTSNEDLKNFDPPGEPERGNDWVLVLDDADAGFVQPGAVQ